MRIHKTFKRGFKTTNRKWRMVIYLWSINFIYSVLIIAPVYSILQRDFSRSLMGNQLARGTDLLWLGDVIFKHRNLFSVLTGWFIIPGILFVFLSIFLNGGIIGRIVAQIGKVQLGDFFGDCGKYFFRFFRVFLISIIGYIVFLGIIFRGISALFKLWTKNASTEWPLIFSANLKFLIVLLLFSAVRMFFDYVKVRLVVENSKKTIKATLANFVFIGKRFFKAWALYLVVGIITVVFGMVYLVGYRFLPGAGALMILVFIWQQIYIISKMWTKVLFFSTEYHFYNRYLT